MNTHKRRGAMTGLFTPWTESETALAIEMWTTGATRAAISVKLHRRSPKAIQGKLEDLGLTGDKRPGRLRGDELDKAIVAAWPGHLSITAVATLLKTNRDRVRKVLTAHGIDEHQRKRAKENEIAIIRDLAATGMSDGDIASKLCMVAKSVSHWRSVYQIKSGAKVNAERRAAMGMSTGGGPEPKQDKPAIAEKAWSAAMGGRLFADTRVRPVGRILGWVDSSAGLGASSMLSCVTH